MRIFVLFIFGLALTPLLPADLLRLERPLLTGLCKSAPSASCGSVNAALDDISGAIHDSLVTAGPASRPFRSVSDLLPSSTAGVAPQGPYLAVHIREPLTVTSKDVSDAQPGQGPQNAFPKPTTVIFLVVASVSLLLFILSRKGLLS